MAAVKLLSEDLVFWVKMVERRRPGPSRKRPGALSCGTRTATRRLPQGLEATCCRASTSCCGLNFRVLSEPPWWESHDHNHSETATRPTPLCGNPFGTGMAASTGRLCHCNCQLGGGRAQGCRPGEGSPSQAAILQSLPWGFGAGFPGLLPDTTPRRTATHLSGKSAAGFH